MTFLERFKRQVEDEEEKRKQKQIAEAVYHKQKREQSIAFRQESGVAVLMESLTPILRTAGRLAGSTHCGTFFKGSWDKGLTPALQLNDTDSVYDRIAFDRKRSWEWLTGFSYTHYDDRGHVIYRQKVLLVEVNPDGDVVFYGQQRITVTKQNWFVNKAVLENVLEQIFNKPSYQEERYFRILPGPPYIPPA